MKQQPVLNINIPNPCVQDWAAMLNAGDGKHCSQCNNIVYDFSQMSDDELLVFFKHKPNTHCGRFHNSQLRRDILPAAKPYKIFLSRFNKVAAAFFTILSFKSISSKSEIKNTKQLTVFDSNYKYKAFSDSDKIIISGTIKGVDNMPLEKATVTLDSRQMAVTDKDGKFSFQLDVISSNSHNLYFSYDSLVTIVRTYHPVMLSSNYDITLYKPGSLQGFTGGIMMPPGELIGDLPSLTFKTNSAKLSADAKALLSAIALKLKQNPGANIKVQGYPVMNSHQFISNTRVMNIRKYLIEKEGISQERMETNCQVGGGDINIVDIIPTDK